MIKYKSQNGAALLTTMIILILITIIGLAAISFSTFNIQVAGFKLRNTENFYSGESVALEATSIVDTVDESDLELVKLVAEEAGSELTNEGLDWVYRKVDLGKLSENVPTGFTTNPKFVSEEDIKLLFLQNSITFKEDSLVVSDPNIKTKAIAIYNGIANEGSQDIGKGDALREYIVFAQLQKFTGSRKIGEKIFEIGIRRKF